MEILTILLAGIMAIAIIGAAFVLPLRFKYRQELRALPSLELESLAFLYEQAYFSYIGHDHQAVQRYKKLTDNRDLPELRRSWRALSRTFVKLERDAGHRGRPLILDYYNWHELVIAEMTRRSKPGQVRGA